MNKRLFFIIMLSFLVSAPLYGQFQPSVTPEPVTCFGDTDGVIHAQVTGGIAPYRFILYDDMFNELDRYEGDNSSHSFYELAPGTYYVIIRDDDNSELLYAVVGEPDELIVDVLPEPADICPDTDRQLHGQYSGGNGEPYTHLWTGSGAEYLDDNTIEAPVFNSGDIGVHDLVYRVEDHRGCFKEESVSIEVFEDITAGFTHEDVTCFNGDNGSVTIINEEGGSGSYEYMVEDSDWQETPVFEGLTAGEYDIWIRDALNPDECTVLVGTAEISQPDLLTADISHTDVTCYGGTNGAVSVESPDGGSGSYQYRVSGFDWQEEGLFEGLIAGDYVVEIRDAGDTGCVIELDGSYTVSEPDPLTADISHTNVTCYGGSDGTISVESPDGGSGSYQYRVSGFDWQEEGLFEGLIAGDYVVEIRDAGDTGCVVELDGSYEVQEPSELAGSIEHEDVTLCHGYSNGWIEISSSGGWAENTGEYEYSIDGGESWSADNRFEDLPSGYYNVKVRDAGYTGCSLVIDDNYFIDQPEEITADVYWEPVSCHGGDDGLIRFDNTEGGSGMYYYTVIGYETYEQSNNVFDNLPAGTYDLRISDLIDEDCIVIIDQFFELPEADELNASVSKSDVTGCHGNDNGEIVVDQIEGGSGNYQYSADDGASWQEDNNFTNLTAGEYPVWIRDADVPGCTKFLENVEITEPEELQAGFEVNDVSCFGGSDASILITDPQGGSGSYEFSADGSTWQEEQEITSLEEGEYTVLMRDMNFPVCEIVLGSATIDQPEEISVDIPEVSGNNCHGSNDGIIEAIASGGTPGYIYSLYEGGELIATSEPEHPEPAVFEDLYAADNYRIVVTDSRGCDPAEVSGIVVAEPDELVISSVDVEHIDCYGSETGKITISASGGTGNIKYSVNGVDFYDNGGVFENLPAGVYDIKVKDENDCITEHGNVEVTQPGRLSADITVSDITCHGAENGRIEISNTGGGSTPGNYEYSIDGSNWIDDPLFENLTFGTYNVFIRDADVPGCFVELDESPVEVAEPEVLEMEVNVTHVDCHGNSSGMIEIFAEGGNENYEYRLDGGEWQETPVFEDLPSGEYLVETRDKMDCSVSEMVEITEPDDLNIFNIGVNNESCFEAEDGRVTITPEGGTPAYLYSIDGGETFQEDSVFTDLAPGFYDVRVMDYKGCVVDADIPARIRAANEIVFDKIDVDHISCYGAGDGELDVEASGGEPSLQYSIDNESWQDNGNFSDLDGDIYTLWVRDIRDCTVSEELQVDEPDSVTIDIAVDDIDCFGAGNGVVYASAEGGSGDYTYSLFEAETDMVAAPEQISSGEVEFGELEPGDYYVIAVDENGCASGESAIVTVGEPEELIISLLEAEDISCYGADDGTITITAEGGTGELIYSADGGESFNSNGGEFTGLPAGTYNIVVTDEKGCEKEYPDPVEIIEPAEIELISSDISPAECHGSQTGSIRVTADGGTGELEYSLDNDSYQVDGDFENISGGDYTLYVRDENECIKLFDLSVPQPDELVLSSEVLNTECGGIESDPKIRASATGGTAPYVITLYLEGDQQASFENIDEDETVYFEALSEEETGYEVVVHDDAGCPPVSSGMLSTEIPDQLEAGLLSVLHLECHGVNEGGLEASITGGTTPYYVQLYMDGVPAGDPVESDGTVIFEELAAGTYSISVTDVNGCGPFEIQDIEVDEPDQLLFGDFNLDHNTCIGDSAGIIETEAFGGTQSYVFTLLDNENEPVEGYEPLVSDRGAVFEDLPAGTYRIRLTDENSCGPVISSDKEIEDPEPLDVQVDKTDILCYGQENGSITMLVEEGGGTLEYSIDGGFTFHDNEGVFENLGQGSYEIVVLDSDGCTQKAGTFEITEPQQLDFVNVETEDIITGSGDDNGVVTVEVAGGVEPYTYSIDDGTTWQDENVFDTLSAGEHNIIVRDDNECTGETTAEIREVTGIDASVSASDPTCNGYNNGAINVEGELGTEPYEYSIDGGIEFSSSGNFDELKAGTYMVVVKDDEGLEYHESVTLNDPASIEAAAVINNASCSNFSLDGDDGGIELEVTGGSGGYSYLWSNDEVTRDLKDIPAGDYSVVITDENECEESFSFTVDYDNLLEATLPEVITICSGEDVQLEPSVNSSSSPEIYSWLASDGPDPDSVMSPVVAPSAPTNYSFRVADSNRCYDDTEVYVDMHPLQGLSIGNDTVVYEGSTITLEASGGEFVDYKWKPSAGLSEIEGHVATAIVNEEIRYYLFAETAEGCIESDSILIGVASPIEPVSGFAPNGDGRNDYFEILNAQDYPDIVVEVYNRAGQRVFYSEGYSDDKRWDGTYNGRDLPMGTYYYVITLNDKFGTRPVTGPVTIVR